MNSISVHLPEVAFSTISHSKYTLYIMQDNEEIEMAYSESKEDSLHIELPLCKQIFESNTAQDQITSFQFHIFHQIPPQSKLPHGTGRLTPHGNYLHSYEAIPLSMFAILQAVLVASFPFPSVEQKCILEIQV